MNIQSANNFSQNQRSSKICFEHNCSAKDSKYNTKQKAIVATTTALGVGTALSLLSHRAGYSYLPKIKNIKNIKNSYIAKTDFFAKEVISIGTGSCLGGLAGGFIIDKDKQNRKAKLRESLMQIGNISIPILTVDFAVNTLCKEANKGTKALAGVGGIFAGVFLANFIMNKMSNLIFKQSSGRDVKATDYSAHLDDMVLAANCVSKSPIIHFIGRFVPVALMVAGNEIGNKKA